MCLTGIELLISFFITIILPVLVIALVIKILIKPEPKRNHYAPYTAFRTRNESVQKVG
jgi:hypothetical protein